ncbi:MAG: phage/plasmid primase, P4 family [Microcella sp.]|uniref:phage/plasmid primase, P4 family n=1 Tax=Microcella sp. TaxID=1913979 RepID=UPI003314A793
MRELPPVLDKVLSRFEDVRGVGADNFMARCSAHDDDKPSLSIGWGEKGKVILHCQAGCDIADVLSAASLTFADLEPRPRVVESYDYEDEDGLLRFQVQRYEPKDFRQRRPDPARPGKWINNMRDGLAPLIYNLPRVAPALTRGDDVYIVEGEKDVAALWQGVSAVATCNAGGVGMGWKRDHSEFFIGTESRVVIVADRDAPGYKHALSVHASLAEVGVDAEIVHSAEGKDAADHISNHGLEQFLALTVEEARELAGTRSAGTEPSVADLDVEYPLTELGNAERLVARHGHELRHLAPTSQWLIYLDGHWATDQRGVVMGWMRETVRAIRSEAEGLDPKTAAPILSWAKASESRSRLESALKLAQTLPGVAMLPKDFDLDPSLLNVCNGTLDLRTGVLREHRPEDHLRRQVPVDFDPEAGAPMFDAFVQRVLPDPDIRAFIQRAAGYSATGATSEQKLLLLHSSGQSGKSTLVELMFDLFGPYATTLPAETLAQRNVDRIPNDIARLDGARFVSVIEFDDSARINERLVKQLTGGDTVTARFMRGEFFDFRPQCTIWVSSNHRPVVTGTDEGIWRRFLLVDFPVRIPDSERDDTLGSRIRAAELPGILRWVVEGAVAWHQQGLNPPASVLAATADYRNDSDLLGMFLDEYCDIAADATVSKADLFDCYKEWCHAGNLRPATKISFGRKLRERSGLDISDAEVGKAKTHVWVGLRLRDRSSGVIRAVVTPISGEDGGSELAGQLPPKALRTVRRPKGR